MPPQPHRSPDEARPVGSGADLRSYEVWRVALPIGLAATLLRAGLMPDLSGSFVYALAYPATVVAALFGGWRAALAVTLFCAASTPLALGTHWDFDLLLAAAIYIGFGFAISAIGPRLGRRPRVDTQAGAPGTAAAVAVAGQGRSPIDTLRLLHDSSPDGFEWLRVIEPVDGGEPEFEWVYANPAAAAWLGESAPALSGRRVRNGPRPTMQALRAAHWAEALRIATPLRDTPAEDTEADRRDGAASLQQPVESLVVPLGDHVAVTTRFAGPQAESRTAAAAEGRLIANLSHELRTPLNAISGWAHLLSRGANDPKLVQRAVDAITRNAQSQAELIDKLLDASRIAGGSLRMERQRCNLGAVLRAALDESRAAAQSRWVTLDELGLEASHVQVDGNADRLQQVFVHLLNNAIQHTPLGGHVQVKFSRVDDASARIEIRDNGDGISAELMPHVFEQFEQGSAARSRRHGGLGLGLPLVRALVELHGGSVQLKSDGPGRGTTALVELPLLGDAGRAADAPTDGAGDRAAAPEDHAEAEDSRYAWRRILVIEDDPDSLDLITELLRRHGAIVRSYDRAESALAAAESGHYDLIISDLGMPGMDGIEFMWRLKRSHHLPTNAIALTAHADYSKHDEARDAGYAHVEVKPIRPDHFLHVVDEALAPASVPERSADRPSDRAPGHPAA